MSALTECLGEALVSVTEDRCRVILRFENGKMVEIYPHGPDSELKLKLWPAVHSEGCVRRQPVTGACSCIRIAKGDGNGE